MDANFHGIWQHTIHLLLQMMLSDGRTHFLHTALRTAPHSLLLLAFMVSWMAVPTLYIHLKNGANR